VTKVPRVAMFCVRGLFHKGTPLPLTAAMEGKERGDYGRWCPATGGVRVNLRRRHRRRPGLSAGAFLCTNVAGCAGAGETGRLGVNGGVLNPTFSRSRQSRPLAFRHVLAWLAPPMPASTRSTMARVPPGPVTEAACWAHGRQHLPNAPRGFSRKCNLHTAAQMLLMHPVTRRGKRT
jgi:hypothetical protein